MADRILITMDDLESAVRANAAFESAGYRTTMVSALDDLRSAIRRADPELLVFSGGLREDTVSRLLADTSAMRAATLGLAEPGDVDPVALAARVGLTGVLKKPVSEDEIVRQGRRLIDRRKLQLRTGILGDDPGMQEVLIRIEQMAPVSSTVLIHGESGTGKELVARAIHDLSPRHGKPFIAVNCAAIPETLLESELFGHEKGSFTGAAERRLGMFELADGGTIFLDEVGEMPGATQVKLLRVLEEREFFRVGGTHPIKVDVRVVAATNRLLKDAMEAGQIRPDLYYRLNVLSIYLPPLRERRGDIPRLVRHFIDEFARRHDRQFKGIDGEAMRMLAEAPWPGNVRELRNLVESMVVLAPEGMITSGDIPAEVRNARSRHLPVALPLMDPSRAMAGGQELQYIVNSLLDMRLQIEELRRRLDARPREMEVIDIREHGHEPGVVVGRLAPASPAYEIQASSPTGGNGASHEVVYETGMKMADVERAAIAASLRVTRGNRRKAAEMLGIGERTLYRKLKEYHLDVEG